ncbi:Uncharacterised protein [Mycobacteroides abscessus subsp. massiliense]|nr:Uncharacterised protein [Mycobacteroides abscessus subsp. massiliense]
MIPPSAAVPSVATKNMPITMNIPPEMRFVEWVRSRPIRISVPRTQRRSASLNRPQVNASTNKGAAMPSEYSAMSKAP